MKKTATRLSWKITPIDLPKRLELSLQFTDEQYQKLKKGFIPRVMEEKWFIFFEDEWLYIHESWTGKGIYKAKLRKNRNGYSISECWVERNSGFYKSSGDESDREILSVLIAGILLGTDVRRILSKEPGNADLDTLKTWNSFGTLLTEKLYDVSDQPYYEDIQALIPTINYTPKIKAALLGLAIGDALGVPVEFKRRENLRKSPVINMQSQGTHHQPVGTFSDDSSLTFCLAEALTKGFNLETIGRNFVKWKTENYWTANGVVFDIGNSTREAILRIEHGVSAECAGGYEESENGNGSLMRILPLVFYLLDKSIDERFEITRQVSSITHRHIRSVIACFYYLEFARHLLLGHSKGDTYEILMWKIQDYLKETGTDKRQLIPFERLLKSDITILMEEEIKSTGYVVDTLEASIWCLMTTDNYQEAVLKAVNLGDDTDTTAAVTGGLAGLLYGREGIPVKWELKLARIQDIVDLAERMGKKLGQKQKKEVSVII